MITRKISRTCQILVQSGPRAFVGRAYFRLSTPVRDWYRSDNWLMGKLVELGGNRYRLSDLTFSVDNPRIATRYKSRFFRGDYEQEERGMLERSVDGTLPVVEFGACIGVVSCLTNRRLRQPDRHVVVEANPFLIPTLEANRDRNGCQFAVLNRALAHGTDRIEFFLHDIFVGGSVQRQTGEPIAVQAITLAEILDSRGFERADVVCDAEGAEVNFIEVEADVLRSRVRNLLIEMHPHMVGQDRIDRVKTKLAEVGFTLEEEHGIHCRYKNASLP